MLWFAMLACGGDPTTLEDPDVEVEVATMKDGAPRHEDNWGQSCVKTNELGCMYWGKKARKLGQDYREFLEPSCDRAHAPACLLLGEYLKDDGEDAEVTTPLYQRACEMGAGDGCLRWADTLEGDARQATLEKGCALKSVWCCKHAGLPTPTW